MKQSASSCKRGFTLMELMVAMAITTIIVTVLVSITSIAIDTWNRSRSELRASRQAQALVETMSRDFEALITRTGNESEWLVAESANTADMGPSGLQSTNAAELIFFTAAMDRYEGNLAGRDRQMNTADDPSGGDVSCVGYGLSYRDPIGEGDGSFKTFVLNRILVDPDDTYRDLLGNTDLETAFRRYSTRLEDPENFVCENVFQFTVTFLIEVVQGTGESATVLTVPVTVGQNRSTGPVADRFRIRGSGIEASAYGTGLSAEELQSGKVKAVEISLTVLSDAGIDQMRRRPFPDDQAAEFLAKNSYQYSKRVQLPVR